MLEAVEKRFGGMGHPRRSTTAAPKRPSRPATSPKPLLHPGPEPPVQRRLGELCQNLQTRLCSRKLLDGCDQYAPTDHRLVRGPKNQPSSLMPQNAIPSRVPRRPVSIAVSGQTGATPALQKGRSAVASYSIQSAADRSGYGACIRSFVVTIPLYAVSTAVARNGLSLQEHA